MVAVVVVVVEVAARIGHTAQEEERIVVVVAGHQEEEGIGLSGSGEQEALQAVLRTDLAAVVGHQGEGIVVVVVGQGVGSQPLCHLYAGACSVSDFGAVGRDAVGPGAARLSGRLSFSGRLAARKYGSQRHRGHD